MTHSIRLILIGIVASLLTACAGRTDDFVPPKPDDAAYAPPELNYEVSRSSKNSLYTGPSSMALFQDRRAYRVGDILTVTLDEETKSDKKATTKYGKSSSANYLAPTIGGKTYDKLSANLSGDNDFSGSAASAQGNSLSGSITVTVYEVLPNGVLRVRGEKWLKLNQGDEFIRLTGNVRVDDIGSNNTLSSQRIADARITYAGRGTFSDTNSAGWFTRFLNTPWMPF